MKVQIWKHEIKETEATKPGEPRRQFLSIFAVDPLREDRGFGMATDIKSPLYNLIAACDDATEKAEKDARAAGKTYIEHVPVLELSGFNEVQRFVTVEGADGTESSEPRRDKRGKLCFDLKATEHATVKHVGWIPRSMRYEPEVASAMIPLPPAA